MKIIRLKIQRYIFDDTHNPYAFNNEQRQSVEPIAKKIEQAVVNSFDADSILVRGVQSGHHTEMSKKLFVDAIIRNSSDMLNSDASEEGMIHAAPYEPGIITGILEGFHVYRPKCEERPQYPVDVWMVFDKKAFDNIRYIHPRHHVPAKDRWKPKSKTQGLLGIIILE